MQETTSDRGTGNNTIAIEKSNVSKNSSVSSQSPSRRSFRGGGGGRERGGGHGVSNNSSNSSSSDQQKRNSNNRTSERTSKANSAPTRATTVTPDDHPAGSSKPPFQATKTSQHLTSHPQSNDAHAHSSKASSPTSRANVEHSGSQKRGALENPNHQSEGNSDSKAGGVKTQDDSGGTSSSSSAPTDAPPHGTSSSSIRGGGGQRGRGGSHHQQSHGPNDASRDSRDNRDSRGGKGGSGRRHQQAPADSNRRSSNHGDHNSNSFSSSQQGQNRQQQQQQQITTLPQSNSSSNRSGSNNYNVNSAQLVEQQWPQPQLQSTQQLQQLQQQQQQHLQQQQQHHQAANQVVAVYQGVNDLTGPLPAKQPTPQQQQLMMGLPMNAAPHMQVPLMNAVVPHVGSLGPNNLVVNGGANGLSLTPQQAMMLQQQQQQQFQNHIQQQLQFSLHHQQQQQLQQPPHQDQQPQLAPQLLQPPQNPQQDPQHLQQQHLQQHHQPHLQHPPQFQQPSQHPPQLQQPQSQHPSQLQQPQSQHPPQLQQPQSQPLESEQQQQQQSPQEQLKQPSQLQQHPPQLHPSQLQQQQLHLQHQHFQHQQHLQHQQLQQLQNPQMQHSQLHHPVQHLQQHQPYQLQHLPQRFPGNPQMGFLPPSPHGLPPGHYIIENGQLMPSMNIPPPAHMQMMSSQQGHFMIPSPQPQQQQSFHHHLPQHPPIYYHNPSDVQRQPGNQLMMQRMAGGVLQGNSLPPPFIPQQQQIQMQQQLTVTAKATRTEEDTETYSVSRPPPSEPSIEPGPDVAVASPLPSDGMNVVSDPLPFPAKRERKPLIIRSKEGVTINLDTFRRPPNAAASAATVESVPATSLPPDLPSATTTEGGGVSEPSSSSSSSSLNQESNASSAESASNDTDAAVAAADDAVAADAASEASVLETSSTAAAVDTTTVDSSIGPVAAAAAAITVPSSDVLPTPSSSLSTVAAAAVIVPVSAGEAVSSLEQPGAPIIITDEGCASSEAPNVLESSADPCIPLLESTAPAAVQAIVIVSDDEAAAVCPPDETNPPPPLPSSSSSSPEQSSGVPEDSSTSNVTAAAAASSSPSSEDKDKAPILTMESSFVASMVIAPPPVEEHEVVPSFPVYIAPSASSSSSSMGMRGGKSLLPDTDNNNNNNTKDLHKKNAPSETVYVNPSVVMPTRSKKSQKKEMLASADALGATADEDSMLSAYTAVSKAAVDAPTPSDSVALSVHKTAAAPTTTTSSSETIIEAPSTVDDSEVVDSWEDTVEEDEAVIADQSNVPVIAVHQEPTTKRSLRPGGSSMLMRLNQAPAVIRFTKQELLNLKPTSRPQINPLSLTFVNISTGDSPFSLHHSSGGSMSSSSSGKMNSNSPLWGKGKQAHSSSSHHHHQHQQQQQVPIDSMDGSAWKRESAMLSAVQNNNSNSNNKGAKGHGKGGLGSMSTMPMPRKVISDPVEVLTTESISILNKITPQTYDKLSQNILELNITNTGMMDKLIQLIFEKAVQEQSFAHLYAELCSFLSKNASHWTFYTIVKDVDSKDVMNYFWIVDHEFSSVAAGPFFSRNDCPSAILSEVPKPMNPINVASFEVMETIVMNSIILRIYRNEKSKEYFVTYLPLSDIPLAERSTEYFIDERLASVDARNKYSFRARLLSTCQQEFQKTTQYEKVCLTLEEERVHYYKTRAVAGGGGGGGDNNSATTTPPPLSEAELVSRIADIEEKQFKLKRRILGNTRFVGELYQVGLVTTNIIHGCIAELLGTPGEWKTVNDEQVILCLCHLITTTGEKLDQKTTHDGKLRGKLNDAYERMRVLSKDKSVNSRMRFSIEEVLNLRENKWQRRRAEEGPLKISEIHQKIIEEEARQQQQEMHHGGGRGFKYQQQQPSTQQQQQQQQTQKSILTRPKSQDVRKQQQQSGGPQQDAAVASAAVVVEQEKGFGRTLSGSTYSDKPSSSSSSSRGGDPLKRSNSDSHPRPINGKISMEAVTNTATATVDVVTTVTSSSSSSIRFDDGKMQNNVKSMLSEYLETNDVSEVLLSLEESHSKAIYGYFVLHVLDRCNNATKVDNKVETILSLLANSSLVSLLLGAKQEIAAALFFSEELKCLVDTTMDIKEAPERMAHVISHLLRASIISTVQIQQLVEQAKQHCLEECLNSAEDCDRIFSRFSSELLLKDVA